MVLVPLGGLDVGKPAGLTTYGSPASAVRAVGHAVSYVQWRAVPAAPLTVPDPTRALAATLPTATVAVTKGCHDALFWQHQAPAQLRFLAASLS